MPGRNRMSPQDESTATQGGDTHGLLPILARRTMGGAGSSARVRQRYAEGRSSSRDRVVQSASWSTACSISRTTTVDTRVVRVTNEERGTSWCDGVLVVGEQRSLS